MNEVIKHNYCPNTAPKLSKKLALALHYSVINIKYFKQIMFAQLSGRIVLPHGLGLSQATYQDLRRAVDDKALIYQEIEWYKEDWTIIRERAEFCAEMFELKVEERSELVTLLCQYRNKQDPSSEQIAEVIATACLTNFHLWESLGLSERSELNVLIEYNFPQLHALNVDNMRWKRFFYRQLCEQGGDYICKAPSCKACRSYAECFA